MAVHSKLPGASALQLLGALALLFLTVDARALTLSPSPSYNGNYTVSWSTTLGCTYDDNPPFYSYQCTTLYENGAEVAMSGYSLPLFGKAAGSYEYQVYWTMYVYGQPYDGGPVEGPVSVTVGTPPPRDPLPTQLTYQYQTRAGDINYDGKTDIFVKRISGGVSGNGVLDSVILRQNPSGGTFSFFAPNAYDSSIASGWSLSSATTVIRDFNVDGYVDVEVKGVSPATGGAVSNDQIIYSSSAPLQPQPLGLRAVDASLKQFVGNSLDYFHDPSYFADNAPYHYFAGYYYYYYCTYMPGNWGMIEAYFFLGWSCSVYYQAFSGYYQDYTGFSEAALAIWTSERAHQAGFSSASTTGAAQGAVEEELDVQVGGWPMEEQIGPTGEHTNPDYRRGLETFWAILGIAQANAQEIETEEAPPQATAPHCINVRARSVAGLVWSSRHASVHYTSSGTGYNWISAFDSVPEPFDDGVLISGRNTLSDHSTLTRLVSSVKPPGGPACQQNASITYWDQLLAAESNYDDDLDYDANPTAGEGYNSNSFIHGLLIATEGTLTEEVWEADRLWGWDTPVPNNAFQ